MNIDVVDSKGCTPLIVACQYGKTVLAGYLMGKGARREYVDKDGDTALHLLATAIVRNRNPVNLDSRIDIMVELLLSYHACDVVNHKGQSPLDIIGLEFTRSHSLDMVIIVKTFLEMKIKQRPETFQQILYGIGRRHRHYANTVPTMLPYLDPKDLEVLSVEPG